VTPLSLADVCSAVGALLVTYGPTSFGAQNVDRVAGPRRWVWVPVSETFAAPEKLDGSLAKRLVSVQIHSWAETEAECEAMQAAVISALRVAVNGRRYGLSSAQWTTRQDAHRGAALVTTLTVELPVPRIAMPLGDGPIAGFEATTVTVTDAEITPAVEE